jgi:hypothetical protein
MGFLWAIFWVPLVMFVVWRVRRRMWFLRHYGHGRHFQRRHGYHARRGRFDDEEDSMGFGDGSHEFGDRRGFGEGFRGFGEGFRGFGEGFRGFARRRGRGRLLFGLFRRLDASPGQEKAISKLVEQISAKLGDARGEFMATRRDLAAALEAEVLDGAALDAVFLRNTELFVKLSRELQTALVGVHEALDGDQRKLLAELLAYGFSGRPGYSTHPAYAL